MKSFKLTFEQIDNIVLDELKSVYLQLVTDIAELKEKVTLESYQQEDLKDFKSNKKHIRKVIQYFSVAEEYEAWLATVN